MTHQPSCMHTYDAPLPRVPQPQDRNLVEESDRHWACIASRRYNFAARRDEVAHLRLATLAQVQVRGGWVTTSWGWWLW